MSEQCTMPNVPVENDMHVLHCGGSLDDWQQPNHCPVHGVEIRCFNPPDSIRLSVEKYGHGSPPLTINGVPYKLVKAVGVNA